MKKCGRDRVSKLLKHYSGDFGGSVDLRPMSGFKGMKGGMPGLGLHVFGDAKVKIRIGLPPDEQDRNVGTPKFD